MDTNAHFAYFCRDQVKMTEKMVIKMTVGMNFFFYFFHFFGTKAFLFQLISEFVQADGEQPSTSRSPEESDDLSDPSSSADSDRPGS